MMPIYRLTFAITYRFVDERGTASTISFDANAQLPFTDVQYAATLVADRLVALSSAHLVGYTITYNVIYTETERAQPQSRVERKGMIGFLTAQGKSVTYQIPAILPEL